MDTKSYCIIDFAGNSRSNGYSADYIIATKRIVFSCSFYGTPDLVCDKALLEDECYSDEMENKCIDHVMQYDSPYSSERRRKLAYDSRLKAITDLYDKYGYNSVEITILTKDGIKTLKQDCGIYGFWAMLSVIKGNFDKLGVIKLIKYKFNNVLGNKVNKYKPDSPYCASRTVNDNCCIYMQYGSDPKYRNYVKLFYKNKIY